MRIYPSKHKIKAIPQSKIDLDLNIPLAYVETDYSKYKIEKRINDLFKQSSKKFLLPEQQFDSLDFDLYNQYEEQVKMDNLFTTKAGKKTYAPLNMIKFEPKKFEWNATVQRNSEYKISTNYNINIGAIKNDNLNQQLITTLMNPSERNMLVYKNIKINNNNTNFKTFTDVNYNDMDFAFIKSHNCLHYDIQGTEEIDLDDFMNNSVNVWFGCEDAVNLRNDFKILIAGADTEFFFSSPIVSDTKSVVSKYYFDLNTITTTEDMIIHNIFTTDLVPILIVEVKNKGFIIISSYTIFDDMINYEAAIYEVLMYVYLKSYKTTGWNKEWITYNLPDYEIINNMPTNKTSFISNKSIKSLVNINDNLTITRFLIRNDGDVRSIKEIEDESINAIICTGHNNGYPIFELDKSIKIDGYTEEEKPAGWKSIYQNGYIYYLEKLHYLIEQDITDKILLFEDEYNNLIIKIFGFKNSKYKIYKGKDTTITIPFIKAEQDIQTRIRETEYTVSIKDNKIEYCYSEDYVKEDNKYELFNVMVSQTEESITIYDMRQLGGGLPEEEEDNFELFDIGHINGRPYRIAGALVLTMPTKYKPYEEFIQMALDKYKTAEDYIAIIFKDEEEDNE